MSSSEAQTNIEAEEYALLHELEDNRSALNCIRAGWYYFERRGDSQSAGRWFFRAVMSEPNVLHHRIELARFLSLDDRLVRSIEWWQGALRLALTLRASADELALIYLELAKLYRRTNRLERFHRYLHLSLKACPGYRPAQRLLDMA